MKLKLLLLSFLFTSIGFNQEFVMESVIFTEPLYGNIDFEFPRLNSLSKENSEVVEKINTQILSGLNLDGYEEEDMYSQEDRDEMNMFKWSDLTYSSEIREDMLYLTFSFFYNTAYPLYIEKSYYFDLKTGELQTYWDIPFQTLFTLSGYLDFINMYWLDSVKIKFEEAVECAGEEEPFCGIYDIDSYHIDTNKLSLSLSSDCFPRYIQSCTPYLTISVELDSIEDHLSDIGKYMLLESDYFTKTKIEQFVENDSLSKHFQDHMFIFAKIDGKYPVSIAIQTDEHDQISGYYYYDKKRINLALKGEIKNHILSMVETFKGEVTGLFELQLDPEYGYIDSGKWFNPAKTKEYDIEFTEVRGVYKR